MGMSKFIEGKPCHVGHTKKYKKTGHCVECLRIRSAKFEKTRAKREFDHWSLTSVKVVVPQVTTIFWNAIN